MGQQRVLLPTGREYSKLSFLSYRHATVEPIVALPVLCDVTGKNVSRTGRFADARFQILVLKYRIFMVRGALPG